MIKLKVDSKVYYKNKKEFVKIYKKLGLHWEEGTKYGDVWIGKDNDKYLRKIPEQGNWKRFYVYNCQPMKEFLMRIGAEEFDDGVNEPVVEKKIEPIKTIAGQLPDNFKMVVGDGLSTSFVSEEFKKRWRDLDVKYSNYTVQDLYREIEEGNERRRKELGIVEDSDSDKEVVIKKKVDSDILPVKSSKKKIKKVRSVVVNKGTVDVKSENQNRNLKRKVYIIKKKENK